MSNREQIEVEDRSVIPFQWADDTPGGQNLGRAGFRICLKSMRGKLTEFWVSPLQQRRNEIWHCQASENNDFYIACYENLDQVGAWLMFPCKEHKAMSFDITVPSYSNYLQISPSGISFWRTDFSSKPFTMIAGMLDNVAKLSGLEPDEDLKMKLLKLDGVE